MPDVSATSVFFGLMVALASWLIVNTSGAPRRLPFWGAVVVASIATLVAQPLLDFVKQSLGGLPVSMEISGDALFIGIWVAIVALTIFERKERPRRVPIWAGVLAGLIAMFALPPALDNLTGKYQDASLRADANACMSRLPKEGAAQSITNACDHAIVVGLCLAAERNPSPCAQSIQLAPGAVADFDPKGEALSALPSNAKGYTLVACRPPHRPSRTLKVGGRGYRGVCLPAS